MDRDWSDVSVLKRGCRKASEDRAKAIRMNGEAVNIAEAVVEAILAAKMPCKLTSIKLGYGLSWEKNRKNKENRI